MTTLNFGTFLLFKRYKFCSHIWYWSWSGFHGSESIKIYSKKLRELDEIVKRMVFESLDLEKYFDEQMKSTNYLLKLMKYRAPEPNESNIGLHTHTDTNIMTILHQDEVGGLEIQTKNNEWIRVKASPNSFVVVAGDTFNVSKITVILYCIRVALRLWLMLMDQK